MHISTGVKYEFHRGEVCGIFFGKGKMSFDQLANGGKGIFFDSTWLALFSKKHNLQHQIHNGITMSDNPAISATIKVGIKTMKGLFSVFSLE